MKADLFRPEKQAYVAAVLGLFLGGAGVACLQAGNVYMLWPALLAGFMAALFALLAAGRVRWSRRQAEEELAVADYRAGHAAGAELFAETDEAVKIAARASRAYARYFLPVMTVLVGVGVLFLGYLLWNHWTKLAPATAVFPLRHAVLSISLFIASILAGSYFGGVSREAGCRYLRPAAAWLFLTGLLFALAGLALLLIQWQVDVTRVDFRVGRVGLGLIMVLAVELIVNVIIDLYRPRIAREEERPLFESRLLGLVTEPGGMARNVATALDYQFGFEVSEVWFYRFIERTVIPFAVLAALAFWLMTCFQQIDAAENGLRIRFGKVLNAERPLTPGLYAKLPWPFDRIYTFKVENVQEIPIGYVPADGNAAPMPPDPSMEGLQGDMTGRVVVWSKTHHKDETNFVVATSPDVNASEDGTKTAARKLPVSVNFLAASIPLYFKVTRLYDYAFKHENARRTLEEVATQEVVRYLANVDFSGILSTQRARCGEELRLRIQKRADSLELGIEIVFVGLQGIHPPVRVGKAFDEVVAAMQAEHEVVLQAEKYAISVAARADGDAAVRKSEAASYRNERIQVAAAEAARFDKQLVSYRAAPQLYVLYSFLDMLENEGAAARKYIVALSGSHEVFQFDFVQKLRPDLTDLDLDKK